MPGPVLAKLGRPRMLVGGGGGRWGRAVPQKPRDKYKIIKLQMQ